MSEGPKTETLLDAERLREDFPILRVGSDGKRLCYIDNAATTQKPRDVIETLVRFYEQTNANVHRGIYRLSTEATEAYESARERVARFIGSPESRSCVFTRNASEAINLVAQSWGGPFLDAGDTVITSVMEHHSNLVPWQQVATRTGCSLKIVRLNSEGSLDWEHYTQLLAEGASFVALSMASNVLGNVNPAQKMVQAAHDQGALILLDGAQAVPHMEVNVQELDCDFLAFSGHKMLGPMGSGVLYAKTEHLEKMSPVLFGGEMVDQVWTDRATWNEIPWKFEAGTPSCADAVALATAMDYLERVDLKAIAAHESSLAALTVERMRSLGGITVYGPAGHRSGIVSFNLDGIHAHDVAQVLDQYDITVRAGHHCCNPLLRSLGVNATARASYYFYNTIEDVDRLMKGLKSAQSLLGK